MHPTHRTSPVTSFTPYHNHHIREAFAHDLPHPIHITLQEFYNLMGETSPVPADKCKPNMLCSINAFITQANCFAHKLYPQRICFLDKSKYYAADHPTSTHSKPDVIAYNLNHYNRLNEASVEFQAEFRAHWPFIEMTVEFHSSGKSFNDRRCQAHSYAAYLLAARPDLESTLGILVEKDCMIVFICNSSGTKEIKVQKPDCPSVLATIVKYLNEGQSKACAGSIIRTTADDHRATFTLCTSGGTFENCTLNRVGYPFGRRTNIFVTQAIDGDSPVRVIKEQRVRSTVRWTEKEILDRIHQGGAYPGVVRTKFFDQDLTSAGRFKVQIGLLDKGTSFMDIDTPRKVLYALYDLLEVCRGLFRDRGVLHRDIHPDNLLWNDSGTIPAAGVAPVPTVFISHLLNPSEPKHKSSIILIDFDNAEIYTSDEQVKGGRSGTPFFMALAIRGGGPLPKPKTFPLSPVLHSDSALIYQREYPDRFKLFGNENKSPTILSHEEIPPVFRHELRYDGESAVLIFFWWIVFAAPQGKDLIYIDEILWRSLSSQGWTRRPRHELTILLQDNDPEGGLVHPEYRQLLPLVESMLNLIQSDYHWVKEEMYKHPEYLHDALQRVILNFVLENKEAPFMDLQKSPEYRPVEIINKPAPLSAATTERRRFMSIRGTKRKATNSTASGLQCSSLASSLHKSFLDRLKVGRARMPATAESSRDTGGQRKLKKRRLDRDS